MSALLYCYSEARVSYPQVHAVQYDESVSVLLSIVLSNTCTSVVLRVVTVFYVASTLAPPSPPSGIKAHAMMYKTYVASCTVRQVKKSARTSQ